MQDFQASRRYAHIERILVMLLLNTYQPTGNPTEELCSKTPFTRYNRLFNRFDNRLYRVNGV